MTDERVSLKLEYYHVYYILFDPSVHKSVKETFILNLLKYLFLLKGQCHFWFAL